MCLDHDYDSLLQEKRSREKKSLARAWYKHDENDGRNGEPSAKINERWNYNLFWSIIGIKPQFKEKY